MFLRYLAYANYSIFFQKSTKYLAIFPLLPYTEKRQSNEKEGSQEVQVRRLEYQFAYRNTVRPAKVTYFFENLSIFEGYNNLTPSL